ncbi:ECF RNA polymerase sigma-E factor [Caulifigura coniformis]|uniref:ECF RNA polymerase sigma-E factor n=1 Tax=Caulifigura coniformis TaxID=2527983 RepID=A0A517SGQ8_9PLAN|nr:sigma-70 family RNA polymerase sigma factor [Caulifigura coniformis]QDT55316.1 ECF RNA polymerase sigma-E factor [Caulifigura coniformis]
MSVPRTDRLLVERIRSGDPDAWKDCIAAYEGRLIAFAESRLRDRAASEDVVQETFVGFLTGLPNYDDSRPLEAFLFAITAHKITDVLRRRGRRPPLQESPRQEDDTPLPDSRVRVASSMARSRERRESEEQFVAAVLRPLIDDCLARKAFDRLKCLELLFVCGLANKDAAARLGISEQDVANHKQFLVARLKAEAVRLKVVLDPRCLGETS